MWAVKEEQSVMSEAKLEAKIDELAKLVESQGEDIAEINRLLAELAKGWKEWVL